MKRRMIVALVAAALCVGGVAGAQSGPQRDVRGGHRPAEQRRAERKDRKPQSEVAAKGFFEQIDAKNPAVRHALDARDVAAAKRMVGKEAAFRGEVVQVFAPKSNNLVILNFDRNFKNAVSAVVRGEDFGRLPKLEALKGNRVLVTGRVEDFQGRPEVVIRDAKQVKVVK